MSIEAFRGSLMGLLGDINVRWETKYITPLKYQTLLGGGPVLKSWGENGG